jgi:OmpA-OmpF porin, OOP family
MTRDRSSFTNLRWPLILLALVIPVASAQTVKVEGLIKARSGPTLIVATKESPNVYVLLTDSTEVSQVQGLFKARRKQMAMAALIPGLAIQAEGSYNNEKQVIAKSVKFKGDDLKQAQSIQAGMHETQQRSLQNTEELAKQNAELKAQNETLEQQQAELAAQQKSIAANQQNIAANQQNIASNRATIEAAVARFGQLDDYYILDEATVYFANGKTNVEAKYKPELVRLSQKAKTIQAFMIEVKGYASAVGSADLNQRLSEDRANNVVNVLLQDGKIPLTNMLAPGAMGVSEQVGNNKTAEGQAENRRVVVRVLQNKGIAGLSAVTSAQ